MELALYCPDFGYYEREKDTIGRRGDFYTSVSVGSLFGELLAFQFAEWLGQVHSPQSRVLSPKVEEVGTRFGASDVLPQLQTVQIVEAGANDGRLAADILVWLREHRPELFRRLEYWIIEPSARRREWQQRRLARLGDTVRWATSLSDL